ncbi:hypothetical protein [Grimontia hollisae]|uniref:hypothetical protein n=1 Tax=Grimontia hollisae TaxID=673 RepID=UPI00165E64D6|nr:hypothetical protein [Grimontia hollisae]
MDLIREKINEVINRIKCIIEADPDLYIVPWKEDDGFQYLRVYHCDVETYLVEISPAREIRLPNSNRVGRIEVDNSFDTAEYIVFYKVSDSEVNVEVANGESLDSCLVGKVNRAYSEFTGSQRP